jgi:hypothetical protein
LKWDTYQEKKWDWPKVVKTEIKNVIFSSATKKIPGPNRISFRILREAHKTIPELFNSLFPALIEAGYHPKYFKKAIGVILKKPQNARPPYRDYELPKAYKMILLLNCLSKVAEKIVATRLSNLAEVKKVLHHIQIGSRRQKSAIDAAILLTDYIQEKWIQWGEKVFIMLMDMANAFAAVAPNQYGKVCQKLGFLKELIHWFLNFLKNRKFQLAFDGEIHVEMKVNAGIISVINNISDLHQLHLHLIGSVEGLCYGSLLY